MASSQPTACKNVGSAQVVHSCKLCVVLVHYLRNCLEMNSISQSLETFAHRVHFTRSAQAVHFHCSCCGRSIQQKLACPLALRIRTHSLIMMVFDLFTPRVHAQQAVKWSSLSFCLSVCLSFCKKILRWRELATFRTSERIRNAPIYLPVPATGLTRSHSLGFLLFSYYPVHFVSHFIYGHQSRPQIICHVYTYIYAHAQQLTLHI